MAGVTPCLTLLSFGIGADASIESGLRHPSSFGQSGNRQCPSMESAGLNRIDGPWGGGDGCVPGLKSCESSRIAANLVLGPK